MTEERKQEILEFVCATLAETVGVSVNEFTATSTLSEMEVNELDRLEVAMAIEDEYGVDIPDEKSEAWVTVQDVITLAQELVAAQS